MKNISKLIALLLVISLAFPVLAYAEPSGKPISKNMRGLWVATVGNMDYPSKPTTDSEVLKSEALKILDYAKDTGFNAVFLQVRPSADAFYKSTYFPWSKYLTGIQGQAPDNGFNPLEFWVSEAHKRGIELHAWINPFRITKKGSNQPAISLSDLDPSHPAVSHPDWVVTYSDGNLYFNPGIPEVRKYIVDSIMEIVSNYSVDGIHFDDYFYPGKDFDDSATYAQYGAGFTNIDDWRRENVNSLVRDVSQAIKSSGKTIRFGISPFGIWANKSRNSLGSDTKGAESYYDQYADTRKWVKDKLLDYIAPQLYWNIGYSIADYNKLLTWWKNVTSGTGVDLYIGMAAYRSGSSSPSSSWYGVSEIANQIKLNAKNSEVKGSIFFNYSPMADSPALTAVIKALFEQQDGEKAVKPVNLSRPLENISTSFKSYYLNGSSDPNKPLYLNGAPVFNRSGQGYYGVLVPLKTGPNIFTMYQKGSYSTKVIYRYDTSPNEMNSVGIPADSVFPQSQEYRAPREELTFYCQAPIGSTVTVRLGNKTFEMLPSAISSKNNGLYPTTYSYTCTLEDYTGTPRNIDLGKPVYTMIYNGITKSVTAPGSVGVIMQDSPFYAKVTKDVADTYRTPTTGNGAAFELYKGMVDYVTGMTGSYVQLSSGQWVRKSNVEIYTSKSQLCPAIKKATYKTGEKWDSLKFDISSSIAATADFDGEKLQVNISSASSAPKPVLPSNSMFSAVSVSKSGNKVQYTLTIKNGQRINGYYLEKTSTGLTLQIKRPVKIKSGSKPLTGLRIMVDPGHGGNESGAIGPLGLDYAEKTINLKTALKLRTELQKLGATVLMTRTTDKTMSLEERLAASRKTRPDMFIAIHANSMEDNIDMNNYTGFSAYYRETLAKSLCETVYNQVIGDMGRKAMGVHATNFYVNRGIWTPSILIESGFVPNPWEFEKLINDGEQTKLAKSLAAGIVKYFSIK